MNQQQPDEIDIEAELKEVLELVDTEEEITPEMFEASKAERGVREEQT